MAMIQSIRCNTVYAIGQTCQYMLCVMSLVYSVMSGLWGVLGAHVFICIHLYGQFQIYTSQCTPLFNSCRNTLLECEVRCYSRSRFMLDLRPTMMNLISILVIDQVTIFTKLTLWLTQAEQTLSEHRKAINKGTSQQLITQYFTRQS